MKGKEMVSELLLVGLVAVAAGSVIGCIEKPRQSSESSRRRVSRRSSVSAPSRTRGAPDPQSMVKEHLGLDNKAFKAADDLLKSRPGSREHHNAQGRLLREATKATGRMFLKGARGAGRTVKSRGFWKGLRGRR